MRPTMLSGPARRLQLAVGVSSVGDGMRLGALPLLAVARTSSPLAVAAIAATAAGGVVVASLVAGALADRCSKRRLMQSMDTARALAIAALVLDVAWGDTGLALLFVVAAVIGVATAIFDVTAIAAVPALAGADYQHLAGRLSAYELAGEQLVGPPIGSTLFGIAPVVPFALDACSFVASGVLLGAVPALRPPEAVRPGTSRWLLLTGGFRHLRGDRLLLRLACCLGAMAFLGAGNMAVLVLLVRRTFGASTLAYGLVLSTGAVGAIVGSLLAGRSRDAPPDRGPPRRCSGVHGGGQHCHRAHLQHRALLALAFLINGLGAGARNVTTVALRLERTPAALLGRVAGAYQFLGRAAAAPRSDLRQPRHARD